MPWEIAKGFDSSAPIGKWYQKKDLKSGFYLLKNGEKVQEGNPSQMVFDVDSIIEYVSKFMTLKKVTLSLQELLLECKMEVNDVFEAYLDGENNRPNS